MPLLRPWLVAVIVTLTACGDDGVVPADPPRALLATPPSVSAIAGDTVRLRVTDERGRPVTATFTTRDSSAFVVDAAGLVTAVAPGSGTVTATLAVNGSSLALPIPVVVRGFTVVPAAGSVVVGGVLSARPAFVGTADAYGTLGWSSSNPASATVSADGTVRGVALGTARITAVSSVDPRLRGTLDVVVLCPGVPVTALSVTPTAVTLTTGGTQQLVPTVVFDACQPATTSRLIRYASSDTTIATVSATGLVTGGRRSGVATITVFPEAFPTVAVTVPVTVLGRPLTGFTIQSITAGDPPAPVDPTAVRGPIRVIANVTGSSLAAFQVRRVELFLGGRLVDQRDTVPPPTTDDLTSVALTVDTSARDPQTGARVFPLGESLLTVRFTYVPTGGGPETAQIASITQSLVLVGP